MTYIAEFDTERKFGVEAEVYGVAPDRITKELARQGIQGWKFVDDDTIEGDYPVELVSPTLMGREGLGEVAEMMYALSTVGCMVNESCGFHVHHCIEDYTGKNMLSLLRLYSKFEPVIDYLVDPSRRGNNNKHCQSMVKGPTLDWVTELDPTEKKLALDIAVQFGVKHPEYETDKRGDRHRRQHKLNVFSYLQRGTVEFRQHEGTVSPMESVQWVLLTQLMVSKAKRTVVSKEMPKRATLGELLRSLKLMHRQRIDKDDSLIDNLVTTMSRRYNNYRYGIVAK